MINITILKAGFFLSLSLYSWFWSFLTTRSGFFLNYQNNLPLHFAQTFKLALQLGSF